MFKNFFLKSFKPLFVVAFLLVSFFHCLRPVSASSLEFTTSSDWNAGTTSQIDLGTKEGQIQLQPTGSWGARNWQSPDLPISLGTAFVSDGTDIYLTRGYGDILFWKYSTTLNKWTTLSNLPKGAYYGADFEFLNGSLYALFGGYQKSFGKYSPSTNTWQLLTDVPDLVNAGGSLVSDGTYLYALRGNGSQDFYRYDVSTNTWSPMTGAPATIASGADLVYQDGSIYATRGANTTTFYKYTISSNTWSTLASAPGALGEDTEITTDGTYIYVTRQSNTITFYRYEVSTNTWSTLVNLPATSRYAGAVYNESDGYVYVFRGNGTYQFWKYNISSNTFVGPEDAPATLNTGADTVFYQNKLYVPRGSGTATFYSYDIATNIWTTLSNAPQVLADDVKGVVAGQHLYFFRGSNTTDFFRFTPETNTWTTLTVAPATVRYGGALAYPGSGDYIYATRGNFTAGFWRYSISGNSWDDVSVADAPADALSSYGSRLVSNGTDVFYMTGAGISRMYKYAIGTNTWTELGVAPFSPYYGTDLSYYNGKIYAVAGWYKTDFYEYTISTNTWRKLNSFAGDRAQNIGAYSGASLENNGTGTFYLTRAGSTTDIQEYTSSSTNYNSSGVWISSMQNLGYVSSWTSFSSTQVTPSDSSISYQTQTSSDGVSWEEWRSVTGGVISSTPQRYIKVKATLIASTDVLSTPVLEQISLTYSGDVTPPTNPNTVVGMSQSVGGVTLTSAQTYRYTAPYFTWSGATDTSSSISGYYVYFGTNASADPQAVGTYQTTSSYQTVKPFSTGTYYLIIKTKDSAGNVSSASTLFEYIYGGISPSQSLMVDTTANFLGSATNVNISNDAMKLVGRTGGFWMEEALTPPPGTLQYGAKNVAYVAEDNDVYVMRGNNSQTFYRYDIDTDTWTTKANAPTNVYMGGGVVEGPSGYLYGMGGYNTTSFWRYDIANDVWSNEDAADTPLTVYYGGSMEYDGGHFIYVIRGNDDDAFWRYDTNLDTWETLASLDFGASAKAVNNNAYVSADMAIDTENKLIYVTAGNLRDGFSVYNIDTNTWTAINNLPALPYLGSSIEYDPNTRSVFYMPGYASDLLFQYDLSEETWTQKSSAPAPFYYGGSIQRVGENFFAFAGNNTTLFYKYDVSKDSWLTPTGGLFARAFQGTSFLTESYGADILHGSGDTFYIIRGNFGDEFVSWNQSTGQVTKLTNLPSGAYVGSSLVFDNTSNKIYYTGGSYNNRFYVYDIATDTWSEVSSDRPPTAPNYGSSMVYDGLRYIYLNRGVATTSFHRFDTQGTNGTRWTTLAPSPQGLGYGAELLLKDGYIYTLQGQNVANNPFYRYNISTNTWSTLTNIGIDVYNDGFLTDGGDGNFYAARGEDDNDFFKYSVSGDRWTQLGNAPARIYHGGAGESNNLNKIYMLAGGGTGSIKDDIYTYVMETATSGFVEQGTYTSQTHDLTNVYKWASLDVVYTKPVNTNVSIFTRSSQNNSTWSSWTAVSSEKTLGTTHSFDINSPPNRYLEIKFELTSADGVSSVVIDNYTIHYYKDETRPTNPQTAGLSVYSNNGPGDAIVSDTWYGHPTPYFDWPDAEATNGSSDTSSGSGVRGYYVYFGTDQEADPQVDGDFQITSSYTASGLVNGTTNYFRVKTIDDADNVSLDVWQPFIYKYDAEPASAPLNVNADPSGYSAIDSFDFSWNNASSSGAVVSEYCYKTGATTGAYSTDQCITGNTINSIPSHKVGANTFYVRTKDVAGNYSAYATAQYYYVNSSNAPAPPLNLQVTPTTNTSNAFAFSWDPPAVGTFYGSVSNLSYHYSINALPTPQSTSATSLKYLNAGAYATLPGDNVFYIVTKDEAGNINYSNYAQVTFSANTAAPGIPLNIDIADVSVKNTKSWKLALSWEVPSENAANPTSVSTYAIFRSTDSTTFSQIATSGGISYVDVGLTQQTYYYKVKACDSTNNCGAFSEIVSLYPDGKFVLPAELISKPVESNVTTKKGTISWSTGRTSDSKVAYGLSSGKYFEEEVSNSEQVTSHILNLTNLSPGTTYYYVAKWTDEDGNTGVSEETTFKTQPAPSTEEPVIKSVGLDTALVEFTSRNASRIRIYFGESSAFGGMEDVVTGSGEGTYTVQLKDLKDGTKYFYKINAFDSDGAEYEGEIHSFTTLPRPKLTNIKVSQVKGTARSTLLVTWESNTQVSSVITYYPSVAVGSAKDEVNIALKAGKHQMVLYDLEPQTTYVLLVKGKDAQGNEALGEVQQVATSADTRPPMISDIKVETEILGTGEEATVQLVVSYTTDEISTAQIEFGEGSGTSYSQKTQEDGALTNNHLVVISELAPAKVYHLRAISKDSYGNKTESLDKVVITPKATENALDLVVTNLNSVFGFLGK